MDTNRIIFGHYEKSASKGQRTSWWLGFTMHVLALVCDCVWSSRGMPSCVSSTLVFPTLPQLKTARNRTLSPFSLSRTTTIDAVHCTRRVLHPVIGNHVAGCVAPWGQKPFVNSRTVNVRQGGSSLMKRPVWGCIDRFLNTHRSH